MKRDYTLSEYINNPLSKVDLAEYRKREKVAAFCIYGVTIPVTLMAMFYIPDNVLFVSSFIFLTVFFLMLLVTQNIKGMQSVKITDAPVLSSGYSNNARFIEESLYINIPEVRVLQRNVELMGRPFIKLEKEIMEHLCIKSVSAKKIKDKFVLKQR